MIEIGTVWNLKNNGRIVIIIPPFGAIRNSEYLICKRLYDLLTESHKRTRSNEEYHLRNYCGYIP